MDIENGTDAHADALFDAAMAQEAERPDLAPPPAEDDVSPAEMLEATVESAKAERAAAGEPEKPAPDKPADRVEFKAEEYLAQRDRVKELEAKLAQVDKASKADQAPEAKAGLFEDPEGWEAQQKAAREQIRDELRAEFRTELVGIELEAMQSRLGEERYKAIDEAVTAQAARDPAFAEALKKLPARGFGKTLEAWYDKNEPLLNPAAYEARLREKILAEMNGGENAPNGLPAGQKPATGASAAGENVVVLPKSLSRQASARAATSADDGDDSEAAIFAAGANGRRA
jgi:hypothetical protein